MRRFFTLALLFSLQLLADADSISSDSGIFGPKYSEILKKIEGWHQQYPAMSQIIDYGKTPQGRTLRMFLVSKPGNFLARPTVIMSGSTHGNEYLALEDRIPEELLKQSWNVGPDTSISAFLNRGGILIFIPILNPDGYDARERENSHGVDLNRDWDVKPANYKGFKEIETRLLSQKLKELASTLALQFRITVDYHCCVGALLYPWSYTKTPLAAEPLAAHKKIGSMVTQLLGAEHGTTGEVLGYYPLGTTKDYYFAEYGALAFTYEGRYKEEDNYLSQHVQWWNVMLDSLATEQRQPSSAGPMSFLKFPASPW